MTLEQLTELFRIMTLINAVILIVSTLGVMLFKDMMARLHGRWFGLSAENLALVSYAYLGLLKAFLIVFNLVPYVSLFILGLD
jgi:multisubunit Na+/H+ antiporter MnhG subunit